jgi:glycosyltransferase involved in cell wall biosynthesis
MGLWKKNLYVVLEKLASHFRDFVITVSDADKQSAMKYGLIDKNNIQTIHNGLAPIEFLPRDEAREKLNLPINKKIWGAIANDYPTKNLDAFTGFKAIGGSMLAVIGNTPNRHSREVIKFLGPKQEASQYLKAFDGVIIPSIKEGMPFVALEAMQAGKPIIASNVGGIPEALGEAAVLIDPGEFKNLDKYIEINFFDEKKSAELSKKALERSKLFTEEKMLNETEKIYKRLLS